MGGYKASSTEKRRPALIGFLALVALALISSAQVEAAFPSTVVYFPAVGRVTGSGSPPSQFYTTVWITNLSSVSTVHFVFQFLQQGQANLSPVSFSDTLAPGQTKQYENVVENTLLLTNVQGAARVSADGEIFASERIFNQFTGAALDTSVGLFFAGVPESFAIGLGENASIQGVNQGTLENFRYNFAIIETTGSSATVHVSVVNQLGSVVSSKDYMMLPFEQIQQNVSDIIPGIIAANARLTATVTAGPGRVIFAGAQLANVSQDSSGFEMSFKGSLLGSAGVTSLNGLSGAVTLSPGTNVTFGGSGNNIIINSAGGGGGGVTSLNGESGAVSLVAGSNVTLTPSGSTITIAASGGGGGGLSAVSHNGTLTGDGTGGNPLAVAAPLNLANGETTFTAAGPTIGVFASTTDTVITPASPAILGTAPVLGVYGQATNGSGAQSWGELGRFFNSHYFGMLGFTHDASTGAAAIYGDQNFGSGTTPTFPIGVWGDSHDGTGVLGTSSSTIDHQWYGVVGYGALGVEGIGMVAGTNGGGTFSYGVEGDSYLFGDLRVGVFGYATGGTTNYAGYFLGNVNINGTVHTSGAAVRLDNPLDPENKYIYHSSVESADMKNLYDGVVTLDARGDAVVQLPQWFEALNRDFRYQLTCIGGFSPVWIEREVAGGQFVIKGEKPGQRVSWQLTGIRHDSWADAHRIPVEVDKPESERGTLLNPADLGQPLERSLEWRINPEYQKAVEKQREAEAMQAQESKN
jgi:hypothetical protein